MLYLNSNEFYPRVFFSLYFFKGVILPYPFIQPSFFLPDFLLLIFSCLSLFFFFSCNHSTFSSLFVSSPFFFSLLSPVFPHFTSFSFSFSHLLYSLFSRLFFYSPQYISLSYLSSFFSSLFLFFTYFLLSYPPGLLLSFYFHFLLSHSTF